MRYAWHMQDSYFRKSGLKAAAIRRLLASIREWDRRTADRVTHFIAEDKLTYAVTADHSYVVDDSIAALEDRHASDGFFRIHRATLVRISAIADSSRTLTQPCEAPA